MRDRSNLSLLIPAYNAAAHLPRLLKSAADQSEPFDEVWVYDDCSSDDTSETAAQYGARVVRGAINRGCAWGKNVLLESTRCDWVHFHDADDLLLPEFVASARRWMEDNVADVVIFGCEERWDHSGELIGISAPDDVALASDPISYTISNLINPARGLYRRNSFVAAGGFDLDRKVLYNEDQAYHCKLARAGLRFRGDPKIVCVTYRRSASMWTLNKEKCVQAQFHVLRKALLDSSGDAHKEAIASRLWQVVAGAAAHLDWETADAAATLALGLGAAVQPAGLFRLLCSISPWAGIRLREYVIRALKPHLRDGYPGWRSPTGLI